jgi:hypothetical protein
MPRLSRRARHAAVEAFLVCDHRAVRRYGIGVVPPAPGRMGPHLRSGYLTRADTPEALARAGRSIRRLRRQLAFSRDAGRGEDPEFGKGYERVPPLGGDLCTLNLNIAPISTALLRRAAVPGDSARSSACHRSAARVLDERSADLRVCTRSATTRRA